MYCHGNYGPVGGLGYWLLFTVHWARCTVFSMSWGPHGPEPALWGANNGMHTTLHNVQWTDICTNLTHRTMCLITLPSLTKCCLCTLPTGHWTWPALYCKMNFGLLCSVWSPALFAFLFSGGTSMTVECALAVNCSDQPWPRMKRDPLLRYNLIAKRILQNFGGWRY